MIADAPTMLGQLGCAELGLILSRGLLEKLCHLERRGDKLLGLVLLFGRLKHHIEDLLLLVTEEGGLLSVLLCFVSLALLVLPDIDNFIGVSDCVLPITH